MIKDKHGRVQIFRNGTVLYASRGASLDKALEQGWTIDDRSGNTRRDKYGSLASISLLFLAILAWGTRMDASSVSAIFRGLGGFATGWRARMVWKP